MSCAWADPDKQRHIVEFCENGAKALAGEGDTDRIGPEFFARHERGRAIAEIRLLARQARTAHAPDGAARRRDALRADRLGRRFPPDRRGVERARIARRAIFYTSGRTSNEAAFLYQLFVRQFGTNNLPDCSNMCHESSGSALSRNDRHRQGDGQLDDLEHADAIFIIGQNPGTNHPRMLTTLEAGETHGAKIIAINPLPEAGPDAVQESAEVRWLLRSRHGAADLFLQVRINGDVGACSRADESTARRGRSLSGGRCSICLLSREQTDGFEAFVGRSAADAAGTRSSSRAASRASKSSRRRDRHRSRAHHRLLGDGPDAAQERRRPRSKTSSTCSCCAAASASPAPACARCAAIATCKATARWASGSGRRRSSSTSWKEVSISSRRASTASTPSRRSRPCTTGNPKVFFALGGNFLSATPDTVYTADGAAPLPAHRAGLDQTEPLPSHHRTAGADSALPRPHGDRSASRAARNSSRCENSMGVVQSLARPTRRPPREHLLSEPAIVCRLGAGDARQPQPRRLGRRWPPTTTASATIDRARHPRLREYNQQSPPARRLLSPQRAARRRYSRRPPGRPISPSIPCPNIDLEPGQLVMTTVRTHDQFNTTIYGLEDRYRGIHNERRVVLHERRRHPRTRPRPGPSRRSHELFQRPNPHAPATSSSSPTTFRARSAATYFPETNVLVPIDSVAEVSNTPTSKYVVIRVTPAAEATEKIDYDRAM